MVLLRADAGVLQGTGHVMRCLTLAEALLARGHQVQLMTAPIAIDWLAEVVAASGLVLHDSAADDLDFDTIAALRPDWVVIDSYRVNAQQVSDLNDIVPVLAIIDGDDRGIHASLYLDQNLGAEKISRPAGMAGKLLAGADYALVRDAIVQQRRRDPWRFLGDRPTIVSFMGGTDPTRASVGVAASLAVASEVSELVIVAPVELHGMVSAVLDGRRHLRLVAPTPDLPLLFGEADLVVSAAGTSAWDVCALGIPAVLVGVVDNQSASLREAVASGLALGIDASGDPTALAESLPPLAVKLLTDEDLRRKLSAACLATFDGAGAVRVAQRMEQEAATR